MELGGSKYKHRPGTESMGPGHAVLLAQMSGTEHRGAESLATFWKSLRGLSSSLLAASSEERHRSSFCVLKRRKIKAALYGASGGVIAKPERL